MEGETYGTISRASESGIFTKKTAEFLHGKRTQEGIFRVLIKRRITRTKYLIEDASGEGILSLCAIPSDTVTRILQKENTYKITQFMIIGQLISSEAEECPVLQAQSIAVFSYESAVKLILT